MIKVAIDGPAGAGKSSIAKAVAEKTGFVYIDTGAMYRAVALYTILHKLPTSGDELEKAIDKIKIDIEYNEKGQVLILCGEDVTSRIREADVSIVASDVATVPAVRLKLVDIQRRLAENHSVIMDGRDIGTYVLPDAEVKIFLTASVEERAKRRFMQLKENGETEDIEKIKKDIAYRDKNDSERKFAPLRQAEDAIYIDTSDMTMQKVIEKIYKIIREAQ
ncbi:MAG: (d)CMP kinase [Firmicutes bacterium]|nr:(d)CMP kinase [Bacillota bacterium]